MKDEKSTQSTDLRSKAEAKLKNQTLPPVSDADAQHLLHELQVHQIELEIQNEELIQARAEKESALLEQYTELYDFAPVGYFTLGENGDIQKVNLTGALALGVERANLMNHHLAHYVADESGSTFNAFLKKVYVSHKKETCEVILLKKDHEPFWAQLEAVCAPEDCRSLQLVLVDITERKLTEESLRVALVKYETLFECFPLGITVTDVTGNILETNLIAEKLLGVSQEEHIQREIDSPQWQIMRPDGTPMPPDEFASVRALKENRTVANVEMVNVKTDATHTWLNVTAAPLSLEGYGVVVTYSDITEQKQAEKDLRKAHNRMLLVLDSIPADIYVADIKTYEILFMNQNMRNNFNGNLVGQVCWKMFRDDSGPCPHCTNEQLVDADGNPTQGVTWEGQNPINHCWYVNYDRAIRWFDGQLVRLQIAVDISERKRAEEELRESEEKFRSYIQYAPDGVFTSDEKGNYIEVNSAACHITGYSEDELLRLSIPDLLSADDMEIGLQHFKNVNDQGFAHNEMGFITKSGEKRFWSVGAVKLSDTRFLGFVQDTTARKRDEEKVKQSQVLSKTIIDSIPGTFYMIDSCGRYVGWNTYQRDLIVGQPENLMVDVYAIDTIHPDDRPSIGEKVANVLKNGAEEVVEGRVLLRGGPDFRWFLMTGTRMMIKDSPVLVGIGIDITERKQAEVQLAAQLDELRRWYAATLGREGRILELKHEVNELLAQQGQSLRYASAETENSQGAIHVG